jgi:tetratricopeptide (TPR) repeat protein
VTPGLPPEFSDYLRGALVWHNPVLTNKAAAREAWERVLALPTSERKYKSTWSAFMLGRSWMRDDPAKARDYFQQVRELTRKGFSDSLGLAAASIGLEAKTHYDHTNFARATELYLDQYAAGDGSAVNSLSFVIGRALSGGSETELHTLATNESTRRAVTAYLISRGNYFYLAEYSDSDIGQRSATAWLKAVERAAVRDIASAEVIALAAYQVGEFDAAKRWIDRAKDSPTAQWLHAKLLLRAGNLNKAAALLAKVNQSFPASVIFTNPPATLAENLFAPGRPYGDYGSGTTAGCEVRAEIGAIKLARREFIQSLDTLLNAGFWMDAAYVAERVLTTDELQSYVDDSWPMPSPAAAETESETQSAQLRVNMTENIRYLLGRRLTREKRGHEAREYYPVGWRSQFDQLLTALQGGQDETLQAEERARRLYAGAIIARTNGLELVGTEVAPDWRVYEGNFEGSVTIETRTNEYFGIVKASELEMERAFRPTTDPDYRFHYRWQAAYLGWAAAQLLPDNSDETAQVLCRAGSWLKQRDPEMADIFYKALVKRCRKTLMGQEADRIRWFPKLDEDGRWIPRAQQPARKESGIPAELPPSEAGAETPLTW